MNIKIRCYIGERGKLLNYKNDEAIGLMNNSVDSQPEVQKQSQQFLCIALGGNSFLHPYIDTSYRKNEWEYYEAYQNSGMKGNPLFSMYTTKSEEKIRQVAGMVEWGIQNQQFEPIDYLIKKGYKFVYQYIQHYPTIDFDHFMRSFAKRQRGKMVKEIDLLYQNIVLWYLSLRNNKQIETENIAWQSFQEVLGTSLKEIQFQKSIFSKEMVEQHQEDIDRLYEEYNIPKNPKFDSLGVFLEFLISDNLKRIYELHPTCGTETAEQLVFQHSPAKYIGALGGWLKTLNIHELDATEQISLAKSDLDHVFLELLYAKKYNFISKDEQDLFFISCLYLKCLGSVYEETKLLYLDQSKQDYYLEMKAKESQIIKHESDLFRRKQEWLLVEKMQEEKIDRLEEELRAAQGKIRQLEQKIESMEDYTDEVHALRTFVYFEDQDDCLQDTGPSKDIIINYIQTKRIFIFGGSSSWQQKLKEHLPTVEFVEVDEKNRDFSKIKRADAVFINTSVFTHSFYKKIIKELSTSKTPLFYLNGQSNIDRTILEIYKWLTE
jgi:hypothetical protein